MKGPGKWRARQERDRVSTGRVQYWDGGPPTKNRPRSLWGNLAVVGSGIGRQHSPSPHGGGRTLPIGRDLGSLDLLLTYVSFRPPGCISKRPFVRLAWV